MTANVDARLRKSIVFHIGWSYATLGILAVVLGWAATTKISGAVVASGALVVEGNSKKVQHPTGGVIANFFARDGDRVKAGDVLVLLDATTTRAHLAIIVNDLAQQIARRARLQAERDAGNTVLFPAELLERPGDEQLTALVEGENRLFELRRAARDGLRSQLNERISQLQEEFVGRSVQEEAKSEEIRLFQKELEASRGMWAKGYTPIDKYTSKEREAAKLAAERGLLQAMIAQTKGRINEIRQQILQIDRDLSSEVGKELREVETKIVELRERRIAAEDLMNRIEILAPESGRVHQSIIHTIRGVIGPGETIMTIVPDQKPSVEIKVAPQDIDQLNLDQKVVLRFSAFNQNTTPEIFGAIARISADTTVDQRTGSGFYTVRIGLKDAELARLGNVTLVPGMPVEAFAQTGQRTILSYFSKWLTDQSRRAFQEK